MSAKTIQGIKQESVKPLEITSSRKKRDRGKKNTDPHQTPMKLNTHLTLQNNHVLGEGTKFNLRIFQCILQIGCPLKCASFFSTG